MTTEPPRYDPSMIELRTAREAVRRWPAMYIGPLDSDASHRLIWWATAGLIRHYQHLGHALGRIEAALERNGSAVVVGCGQQPVAAHGQEDVQLLLREVQVLGVSAFVGLVAIDALSACLTVGVRDIDDL